MKAVYRHKEKGTLYILQGISNQKATKKGWEKMAVYTDSAGDLWSRPIEEFNERYEKLGTPEAVNFAGRKEDMDLSITNVLREIFARETQDFYEDTGVRVLGVTVTVDRFERNGKAMCAEVMRVKTVLQDI